MTATRSISLRARSHRGAAMLLILISLAIATIVATAYLASRDNSVLIGRSVGASAQARWSAAAGIDLTAAILAADFDLAELAGQSTLLNDVPIAGGTLTVDLQDLEVGGAAGQRSHWLWVSSEAVIDGVPQTSYAIAEIDPLLPTAQVDLSDFVIFGAEVIDLSGDATVTRWPRSRLSGLGERIHFGTGSSEAGAVSVRGTAAAIDTTLVHAAGGSHVLSLSSSVSPDVVLRGADHSAPTAAPPDPESLGPYPTNAPATLTFSSQTRSIGGNVRAQSLTANNSLVNVGDGFTLLVLDDLTLTDSDLIFTGSGRLIVYGDLIMTRSRLLAEETGRLDIFVGGILGIDDSYLGAPTDDPPDASGGLPYQSVSQRILWSIPEPDGEPASGEALAWRVRNGSVVAVQMHAPERQVFIAQASALYGRVAAAGVYVSSGSSVFYDPALDRRLGYASFDGPLYSIPGVLRPEVRTLPALSGTNLAVLSNDLSLVVVAGGRRLNNADFETADPDSLFMPNRPRVRMRTLSHGLQTSEFEWSEGMVHLTSFTDATSDQVAALPPVRTRPITEDPLSLDAAETTIIEDDDDDDDDPDEDDGVAADPDTGLIDSVLKLLGLGR